MTIEELSVRISAEADEALNILDQVTRKLTGLEGLLGQTAHIDVDTGAASESITRLGHQLTHLAGQLEQQTRQVAQTAVAEASRAVESILAQSLKLVYAVIDHKRHMNEMTLEEELQLLQQLRQYRQMNDLEIMAWEERVFDVQQEIRKRDAESLNRLSQGLVEALGEKYEAMREAELQRVEESRRAWETWRDDSVQAIEDQIAALDRLAAAEEQEEQDAEELRRIEKLKRDIAYEQDEYNRRMLEEQLAKAVSDREKRLRTQELEEQKAALRAQADEAERKARQELEVLDAEEAAIEKMYDQRLEAAALEAEAEKLLLENNQQEMLALLQTFVPEYDLLGRTMGERLAEGFQQSVSQVVSWMEELAGQMDSVWGDVVSRAGQQTAVLVRGGGSTPAQPADVTITQTVNFNQPVESPGDVARRMESVNQALGEWMSQEG